MFKLLEIHDLGSKGNNFCGRKYLVVKASLHLFQESILLRGKEENQIFAESRKENGNNFIFMTSLSTSFFFCILHNSTNVLRWDEASSVLSIHRRYCPLCRGHSHDLLFHRNGTYLPMHPSTVADLLQRHRQPSHPDAYTAPQERWYFIFPKPFISTRK